MTQWGTVEQRFWAKVDSSGGMEACWPWIGGRDDKGYGSIAYDGITSKRAHRLSLRLAGVEVPDGAPVLHSCDNPPCVNPGHLRVGTQADNVRDMYSRGRGRGPWTHCKRGHALEGRNAASNGNRVVCRTCRTMAERNRAPSYRERRRFLRSAGRSTTPASAPFGLGQVWSALLTCENRPVGSGDRRE